MATAVAEVGIVTASDLLKNWQGHRRLTRKVIDAFPEDKLFSFSVGGMRPFSELAWEFIRMAVPIAEGVATGKWQEFDMSKSSVTTKSELLRVWEAHAVPEHGIRDAEHGGHRADTQRGCEHGDSGETG